MILVSVLRILGKWILWMFSSSSELMLFWSHLSFPLSLRACLCQSHCSLAQSIHAKWDSVCSIQGKIRRKNSNAVIQRCLLERLAFCRAKEPFSSKLGIKSCCSLAQYFAHNGLFYVDCINTSAKRIFFQQMIHILS